MKWWNCGEEPESVVFFHTVREEEYGVDTKQLYQKLVCNQLTTAFGFCFWFLILDLDVVCFFISSLTPDAKSLGVSYQYISMIACSTLFCSLFRIPLDSW